MGSDWCIYLKIPLIAISIHAPRMGSDFKWVSAHGVSFQFQSTLPAWGATRNLKEGSDEYVISIHAPRMGSEQELRQKKWNR